MLFSLFIFGIGESGANNALSVTSKPIMDVEETMYQDVIDKIAQGNIDLRVSL